MSEASGSEACRRQEREQALARSGAENGESELLSRCSAALQRNERAQGGRAMPRPDGSRRFKELTGKLRLNYSR